MRRIIGTISATLAIAGVMAAFIVPGVLSAMHTRSGGEVHSEAQPAVDKAGFPNGRRLADDITDIELRVIAGAW
jgi:Domain of unknown function (DUF4331)